MVDQNDHMDDDLGAFDEGDFLSAERDGAGAGAGKQSLKEIWEQNPSLKIFAGVAGLAVALIGYMVLGGDSGPTQKEVSAVSRGADVKQIPGTAELPPAYEEAVRQANKTTADMAAQSGGSALPTPIARPTERIEAPVQVEEIDPLSEWRREAETRRIERQKRDTDETPLTTAGLTRDVPSLPPPGVDQNGQQIAIAAPQQSPNPPLPLVPTQDQINNMAQQLQGQMQQVLEAQIPKESAVVNMNITPPYNMAAYFPEMSQQGQQSGGYSTTGSNGGTAGTYAAAGNPTMPQTPPKPIITAGTIAYAQILTEANSDVPGPVLADVASGPLVGGRAIGSFQRTEEHLVLQFSRIVKDGVEYPVQAYALDPATTLPGMASDVNRHYISRVMIPAAAAFISGFAEAATQTDKQTVVVDNTVVTDENDLDTREEVMKGLNVAGQQLSRALQQDVNREVTVRVFQGTRIGLLFVNSVMDPMAVQQQQQYASGGTPGYMAGYPQQGGYAAVGQAMFNASPYGQAVNAYQAYANSQQQQAQSAQQLIAPQSNGIVGRPLQ